jgi:alkylhydroperoxidase/carboxymuconolactone decarboxylase family protein YurZ
MFTPPVEELIAIAAAIAANSEAAFKEHYEAARTLGVSAEDVAMAVATARAVCEAASQGILQLAGRHIAADREAGQANSGGCCCGPTG